MDSANKKRKILMVSPYVYPKIGGVERYVYELAKQLKLDSKYEVEIVTANLNSNQYMVTSLDGVEVHHIPTRWRLSNTPVDYTTYYWITKVIDKVQPDIVHAHAPVPFFAEVAAFCAKDRKLVLTYHSGSLRKGIWYLDILLSIYEGIVLPQLFKRADAITTVSQETYNEIFKTSELRNKAKVISPGVHISSDKHDPSSNSDVITYVGRIDSSSRWKGVDVLLKAFAKVLRDKPYLKLQIIGDGDAVAEYMKLASALGISDSTIFTGPIFGEALIRAYRASAVVVLPSTSSAESFGMVLLEAMSLGVPVIGSRIGGIVSLIKDGETGLLCNPGSVQDLEIAISKMLDNGELRKLCAKNGIEKAQNYTWEVQTNKMKVVYDDVMLNENKKIIHVVPAYPPNLGGMEQRVKELVDKLHASEVQLEVITSDMGTMPGSTIEAGVPILRLPKLKFLKTPVSLGLPLALFQAKADVFHIHVAQPYFPIMGALVAFLRRKPYIMHIRAIVESENVFAKIVIFLYKKIFLKFALRGAVKCIILTDAYKDILVREYGVEKSRIVTIPNATYFKVLQSPHKSIAQAKVINLIAVGRLDKQKNYPFMLRVVSELQKFGDYRLTVVGSGVDETVLKKYAFELGIENKVSWRGRLDGKELEEAYESADIFVHTAHFEGFGTVFIEAMAKGLPICASNVLGAIDVVGEMKNGLLCDFSETKFAHAICKLVSDQNLYAEISSNNLTTVLLYRWENIVSETLRLYNDV